MRIPTSLHLLLVIAIGAILSVCGFLVARSLETQKISREFALAAGTCTEAIRSQFEEQEWLLQSVRAYWNSSREVERGEFHEFTRPLLARYKALVSLEWAPRVARGGRAALVAAVVQEGLQSFDIRERGLDGSLVAAPSATSISPSCFSSRWRGWRQASATTSRRSRSAG